MNIYIAGPMQGIPNFNFPKFNQVAGKFRKAGASVFNPAERDVAEHGEEIANSETGNLKDVAHLGFSLRKALSDDTQYICNVADTIAMLPGWENSKGAQAEWALARALGHKIIYVE